MHVRLICVVSACSSLQLFFGLTLSLVEVAVFVYFLPFSHNGENRRRPSRPALVCCRAAVSFHKLHVKLNARDSISR